MKLDFKGKAAVVTGASGGMGLDISKKLSQNNISVLMLDLQNPSKDFLNINKNCGSTFPNNIRNAVKKYKEHLGISLDGDADRIIHNMCNYLKKSESFSTCPLY